MAAEFGSLRTTRARRALITICEADDTTLRIIANELDLPMDDGESPSFLTDALREAARRIDIGVTAEKLARLRSKQP